MVQWARSLIGCTGREALSGELYRVPWFLMVALNWQQTRFSKSACFFFFSFFYIFRLFAQACLNSTTFFTHLFKKFWSTLLLLNTTPYWLNIQTLHIVWKSYRIPPDNDLVGLSPGQGWGLQSWNSVADPEQGSPPFRGSGLLQNRFLDRNPNSHSREQTDQAPHELQPPLITRAGLLPFRMRSSTRAGGRMTEDHYSIPMVVKHARCRVPQLWPLTAPKGHI